MVRSKSEAARSLCDAGQIPAVAGQQPPLPPVHLFAGVQSVGIFRFAEERHLHVAAVDRSGVAHLDAEHFVAFLQKRIFGRDFAQTFRVRIHEAQIVAPPPRRVPPADVSIASSTGSSRFSESTTSTRASGIGALQLPRYGLRRNAPSRRVRSCGYTRYASTYWASGIEVSA